MRTTQPRLNRILVCALLATLLLSVLGPQTTVRADGLTHVVQPGENLFRIGLRYGVPWTAIMQANGLSSTNIYVGQTLVIPTANGAAPAPEVAPAAPGAESGAPSTYVVQRGDSLFQIAIRFGVTAQQLAVANGLSNPSLIYAGQTLTIPGGLYSAPAAAGPKSIVVDLSEQHLYAYAGETLVYSFVASTGERGRETRPGNYSVLTKIPNAYGSLWNIWMPNWLGIYWAGNLQNGIHALPILPGGSRLWDGYLGTPVSYGCVILGVWEADALYNWAEIGTPVTIQW